MNQSLLAHALSCQCVCKREPSGIWKILPPPQKTARWQLQQVEDRWLLVVGGVAQVKSLSRRRRSVLEALLPNPIRAGRCLDFIK